MILICDLDMPIRDLSAMYVTTNQAAGICDSNHIGLRYTPPVSESDTHVFVIIWRFSQIWTMWLQTVWFQYWLLVEFEPVRFLVLYPAGPRPDRTGIGSLLDWHQSMCGVSFKSRISRNSIESWHASFLSTYSSPLARVGT